MLIAAWFAYWFVIWGIYNFILIPKNISFFKDSVKTGLFFIIATLAPSLIILKMNNNFYFWLIPIQIVIMFIFIKKYLIEKSLFFDVVFQQSMLYLLYMLTRQNFLISPLLTFIMLFSLSHIPVLMLKHISIKGKLLIYVVLLIGSCIMFLIFYKLNLLFGVIFNIVFHFSFYFYLTKYRKKNNWGIIV